MDRRQGPNITVNKIETGSVDLTISFDSPSCDKLAQAIEHLARALDKLDLGGVAASNRPEPRTTEIHPTSDYPDTDKKLSLQDFELDQGQIIPTDILGSSEVIIFGETTKKT